MTLIEKLNQELNKQGLEFKSTKEYQDKFKGILIDKRTEIQTPFEVMKCLQYNMIESHAKWCRGYMDTTIQFNKLTKGGNK